MTARDLKEACDLTREYAALAYHVHCGDEQERTEALERRAWINDRLRVLLGDRVARRAA